MNCGEMLNRLRRAIPSLTVESASDDVLRGELNIAVNEVNRWAQAYTGYTEFNFVPEQQLYPISQYVPRYLGITKSGVWWQDASSTFQYRIAKTMRWLDLTIPNWRDAPSGQPFWYFIDGNNIGFYQKPSTAYKVRVHHLMKAIPMDNNNNYPWENTTTELTALQPLDDAIVAFARFRLSPAVGKEGNENPIWQEYLREINKAMQQIRRRKDLTSDADSFERVEGITF